MQKFVPALIAALMLTACQHAPLAPSPGQLSGFDRGDLDQAIRPQDDFYRHVNGRWMATTQIPPEWSRYGTMQIVYERAEEQIRVIVQEATRPNPAADPDQRKIGDLYNSFMDVERIETRGLQPIEPDLARIDAIRSHEDLVRYFGHALTTGITVPVNFYVDASADRPEQALAYWWQDGLGLPDRDYYLSDAPKLVEIRDRYRQHIIIMFELTDWPDGAAAADTVIDIETQLAELHWTRVQNRDRETIYRNRFTIEAARQLSPGFDWPAFLIAGDFGTPDTFVIAQTDYFAALGRMLRSVPVTDWRQYLRFNTLRAFAPFLTESIVNEDFAFRQQILRGQETIRPRWKRGTRLTSESLGEAVGRVYTRRHFPPEAKQRVDRMIENLRAAFGQSIDSLDWMTDDTKAAARRKLALFTAKIGYPDEWQDYSDLTIDPADLVGNVRRVHEFEHREAVAKLVKPVDRSEWGMTPQTVNAYYRATLNEIVFPAAILQPPFFDFDADDAFNYGAIGAVIGHEFSHGFDDQGRKFDGQGRLADWWTDRDTREYQSRSAGLVEQYGAFFPLPDLAIDGELTLGENIADLTGLIMAYRAWRILIGEQGAPEIDGFSGDERFFIGFATIWRTKIRDEALREMLLSDPHSPPEYRVTGALRNMQEFYDAFDIGPGDGMYVPEQARIRIW